MHNKGSNNVKIRFIAKFEQYLLSTFCFVDSFFNLENFNQESFHENVRLFASCQVHISYIF